MSTMAAPRISAGDRLSLTLFVSIVIHALIVLGVGFTWGLPKPQRTPPMLEVTLAQHSQEKAPDDYDFLAQSNQDGGGTAENANVPERPQKALTPGVAEGNAAVNAAPAPSPKKKKSSAAVVQGKAKPKSSHPQPKEQPKPKKLPSAAELINDRRQVAAASEFSEINEKLHAKYPSKRRIDARTKAHAAAAYMREWIHKVERVGNLNYPREARARRLAGRLIVEVTIRPDGSVNAIKVLRPSPYPVLNQAAQRIVDLAAPFAPVPKEVLQGKDLLVITRTWRFQDGAQFSAR